MSGADSRPGPSPLDFLRRDPLDRLADDLADLQGEVDAAAEAAAVANGKSDALAACIARLVGLLAELQRVVAGITGRPRQFSPVEPLDLSPWQRQR